MLNTTVPDFLLRKIPRRFIFKTVLLKKPAIHLFMMGGSFQKKFPGRAENRCSAGFSLFRKYRKASHQDSGQTSSRSHRGPSTCKNGHPHQDPRE
jgi:hypothetical protein